MNLVPDSWSGVFWGVPHIHAPSTRVIVFLDHSQLPQHMRFLVFLDHANPSRESQRKEMNRPALMNAAFKERL